MAVSRSTETVQEIYGLVWTAIRGRQPINVLNRGRRLLLCPHVLGRNKTGEFRVLCYQYGGDRDFETYGSSSNWRCIALEDLANVELIEGGVWRTTPGGSRPKTCASVVDVDTEVGERGKRRFLLLSSLAFAGLAIWSALGFMDFVLFLDVNRFRWTLAGDATCMVVLVCGLIWKNNRIHFIE